MPDVCFKDCKKRISNKHIIEDPLVIYIDLCYNMV